MKRCLTLLLLVLAMPASSQQEIYVNDGGTLREITQVFVNDGGVLREITQVFVNDGGTLRQVFSGIDISPSSTPITLAQAGSACYAGVRFGSDGKEDMFGPAQTWANTRDNWLDLGPAANVWVERTVNSGGLNHFDPGAGRLQLNTTRSYAVVRLTVGTSTANVTFDFYDAASGGTLLGTVTYTISAERIS